MGSPTSYDPHAIEARRQAAWRERDAARTPAVQDDLPHLYIKPSAPFTSGNVHIGHVRSYSIGDAYARFRRARGDQVLFNFGFDAFGLPAELGAIDRGIPPSEWVSRCATHMTGQLQRRLHAAALRHRLDSLACAPLLPAVKSCRSRRAPGRSSRVPLPRAMQGLSNVQTRRSKREWKTG